MADTPSTSDDVDIAAIRARLAAATHGRHNAYDDTDYSADAPAELEDYLIEPVAGLGVADFQFTIAGVRDGAVTRDVVADGSMLPGDAILFANAHADLTALCNEVERLRAKLAEKSPAVAPPEGPDYTKMSPADLRKALLRESIVATLCQGRTSLSATPRHLEALRRIDVIRALLDTQPLETP